MALLKDLQLASAKLANGAFAVGGLLVIDDDLVAKWNWKNQLRLKAHAIDRNGDVVAAGRAKPMLNDEAAYTFELVIPANAPTGPVVVKAWQDDALPWVDGSHRGQIEAEDVDAAYATAFKVA